jgi:hypothetical protein
MMMDDISKFSTRGYKISQCQRKKKVMFVFLVAADTAFRKKP